MELSEDTKQLLEGLDQPRREFIECFVKAVLLGRELGLEVMIFGKTEKGGRCG